ncbi:hypothetical protein BH23GEM2_BH23GEM2_21420 [soil metagenome]
MSPSTNVLKVAYVTTYDSTDPRQWSGLGLGIRRCLEDDEMQVLGIGPLTLPLTATVPGYAKAAYYRLKGLNFHRSREPRTSRAVSHAVNARRGCWRAHSAGNPRRCFQSPSARSEQPAG